MIRLAAFDLDGTLLRGDTVCQVLANALGRRVRMDEMERLRDLAAIRDAREEMAGWYAEHSAGALIAMLGGAVEAPGVREGLSLLHESGIATTIISVTWDFAVAHFARRFGAGSYLGTRLRTDGIDHVWPEDKPRRLLEIAADLGIAANQVAAVGDSLGDVSMQWAAGLPIFVGQGPPPEIPSLVHRPGAGILDVARHIVRAGAD